MKDSLGFMFNDIHSSAVGVVSVHDSNGSLYEDTMVLSHSLQESAQFNGNVISTKEVVAPLTFTLTLYFDGRDKDTSIREVIRWLKTDTFKPMSFDAYPNIMVYAKVKTFSNIQHNGVSQGLINVEFLTNSGYLLSEPKLTEIYTVGTKPLSLLLNNDGDEVSFPKIWITKSSKGAVTITNKTTNDKFIISEVNNNEKIFIDGEKRIIHSNQEVVGNFRGNQHNRVWLPLVRGVFDGTNEILIEGAGKYQFEIQDKFFAANF